MERLRSILWRVLYTYRTYLKEEPPPGSFIFCVELGFLYMQSINSQLIQYLSKYPQGLREAFSTGGIPPIGASAEQVYKATYQRVIQRNKEYYKKYPEDVDSIHSEHLLLFSPGSGSTSNETIGLAFHIKSKGGLQLPSGGILTVRVFLTLGRNFGAHGGLDFVCVYALPNSNGHRLKRAIAEISSLFFTCREDDALLMDSK